MHAIGIISHKPHCTVAVSRRELSVLQSAAPNAATERRIVVKTSIVFLALEVEVQPDVVRRRLHWYYGRHTGPATPASTAQVSTLA